MVLGPTLPWLRKSFLMLWSSNLFKKKMKIWLRQIYNKKQTFSIIQISRLVVKENTLRKNASFKKSAGDFSLLITRSRQTHTQALLLIEVRRVTQTLAMKYFWSRRFCRLKNHSAYCSWNWTISLIKDT